MQKLLTIIPFGKSFDDVGFHYLTPSFLEKDILLGQIVKIPFGEKQDYGVIYKIQTYTHQISEIDVSKLKEIISIEGAKPLITKYRLALLPFLSSYYFSPIHNTLNLFLPKNLVEKVKKGKFTFESKKTYNYNTPKNIVLSEKQNHVFQQIIHSSSNNFLLYGITGSGKTEIYIKLIEAYLAKGQQSLLLIPEIILTNQIAERFTAIFGEDILVLNSTVTQATKTKYFIDIALGKAKIIIGTRSALFYPFSDLGIIIIDEEHDNSYSSDAAPRYETKKVAEKITQLNGNTLVLASGTPSVSSMYKATKGEFELLYLLEKYKKVS